MIAGTYVLTDQIRGGFDDIESTAYSGTDVVVTPRRRSRATSQRVAAADAARRRRASARCRRRARAPRASCRRRLAGPRREARSRAAARRAIVVIGRAASRSPPALRRSGRPPRAPARSSIDRELADDQHLRVGPARRRGHAHAASQRRHGRRHLRVRRRGLDRRGHDHRRAAGRRPALVRRARAGDAIVVAAAPASTPAAARRPPPRRAAARRAGPHRRRRRPTQTDADINDAIGGFLTPALLALAGRRPARRRVHHLQHLLDHRRRSARASSRCCARSARRAAQVLRARRRRGAGHRRRRLRCSGSLAGLGLRRRRIGALFDAAGFGIPRAAWCSRRGRSCVGAPGRRRRDAAAALAPALRATRVPPVAALQAARRDRARRAGAGAVASPAPSWPARAARRCSPGLFGSGPADEPAGARWRAAPCCSSSASRCRRAGSCARSPALIGLAAASALFAEPGRLARENAMRNPGRTATTVGGAHGRPRPRRLRRGVRRRAEDRRSPAASTSCVRADIVVTGERQPLPDGAGPRSRSVPGVDGVVGGTSTRCEVNGAPSNATTDTVDGVDAAGSPSVYRLRLDRTATTGWPRRSRGDAGADRGAVREDPPHRASATRFRIRTPSGGARTCAAIGEYRDPADPPGHDRRRRRVPPDVARATRSCSCHGRQGDADARRSRRSRRRCGRSRRPRSSRRRAYRDLHRGARSTRSCTCSTRCWR